jgi:hypothetical protein
MGSFSEGLKLMLSGLMSKCTMLRQCRLRSFIFNARTISALKPLIGLHCSMQNSAHLLNNTMSKPKILLSCGPTFRMAATFRRQNSFTTLAKPTSKFSSFFFIYIHFMTVPGISSSFTKIEDCRVQEIFFKTCVRLI